MGVEGEVLAVRIGMHIRGLPGGHPSRHGVLRTNRTISALATTEKEPSFANSFVDTRRAIRKASQALESQHAVREWNLRTLRRGGGGQRAGEPGTAGDHRASVSE
eukprot:884216-Rhodomonas_salina.2